MGYQNESIDNFDIAFSVFLARCRYYFDYYEKYLLILLDYFT